MFYQCRELVVVSGGVKAYHAIILRRPQEDCEAAPALNVSSGSGGAALSEAALRGCQSHIKTASAPGEGLFDIITLYLSSAVAIIIDMKPLTAFRHI